jgi:putative lipoic acid-binding regulatory protein
MDSPSQEGSPGLALIDYPARFPLKVFGNHSDEFESTVLALVRARIPQAEHIDVRRRESRGGRYLALTLTFTVYTQQQLEDIYRDLYACDQVVMSL